MDLPSLALKRPLCSMSRHNGVVTSVKFSPDGRFLASGSDDKICLIWEKDEGPAQKQFGEAEADLEHWTVRKRLVAHDNDIQDICWSPDGLLLVTVGLDRLIIIWNGVTFERIKRYDIHQSMVKGIVFDPANKYFATASDDRTVRIFRYYKKLNEHSNYEFQMEHIVMEPFKKSPLTSYFRRMSWSPDGQHIAVPNATNGPVSTVVIINRANWGTDVSLIGHEAPCEVCSFSPRLFEIGTEGGKKSKDKNLGFTTVLATAGQDRNLAIWSTANSRPLVVAEDITDNSITDMCWSPDGQTLYLCCLDGSITCVIFEANELGEVVSEDMIDVQLHKYGADRESAIFPESIEQLILEEKSGSQENNFPKHKPNKPVSVAEKSTANVPTKSEPMGLPTTLEMPKVNNLTAKQLTKMTQSVTITKNGKKRVAPLLVQASSKRDTSSSVTQISRGSGIKSNQISHKLSQPSYFLPRLGINTSVHGIKHKHTDTHTSNETKIMDQDNDNEDMGIDETANTANTISESGLKRQRTKLKRSNMEVKYPTSFKKISNLPETLFNNQAMLSQEVNQLVNNLSNNSAEFQSDFLNYTFLDVDEELMFSVIIQGIEHEAVSDPLKSQPDRTKVITTIEVRNGQGWSVREDELTQNESVDFNDPTRVIVSNNRDSEARKYLLYFPFKIQHTLPIVIDQKLKYFVLVSFKGTIQIIHAESGTYLCPSFEMGENVVFLRHVNGFLVVLTNTGLIHSWKLSDSQTKIRSILRGISVASVLNNSDVSSPSDLVCSNSDMKKVPHFILPNLSAIDISPEDGTPFLVIGNSNDIFKYSLDLGAWTKVVDSWYYNTLEDDLKTNENINEALNRLMFKTYNDYKEDVRKSKVNSYTFTAKSQELKDVMVERFGEILQLAS